MLRIGECEICEGKMMDVMINSNNSGVQLISAFLGEHPHNSDMLTVGLIEGKPEGAHVQKRVEKCLCFSPSA